MAYAPIYMRCSILGGILLCFMIATTVTWSSPILPKLSNITTSPFEKAIDVEEASWISSVVSLGALFGMIVLGFLVDKFGRKPTLLIAGIPYLLSHLIIAYSTSIGYYYVARFLMGLTLGSIFVVPVYLAEITHKNQRGTLMTSVTSVGSTGLLFSNVLGTFLSIRTFSFVQLAISVLFLIFFTLFGEESPQYYIMQNKEMQARLSLERLRGGYEDIEETFYEVQNYYFEEKKVKLKDIFTSKALVKAFIISTLLLFFQQFCGIVAILYYGQTLFQHDSFALSPQTTVIVLSVVKLFSSFLSPPLSARFSRKYLFCLSGISMFLSESVLAVYCYCNTFMTLPKLFDILPLFCLAMFIVAYCVGFGPLPWVLIGEIFPTRVKGVATSIVGCVFQIFCFIIIKYLIYFLTYIGLSGYLAFSAGCCMLGTIFVKFYVIETKDKSLEDIQHELSR